MLALRLKRKSRKAPNYESGGREFESGKLLSPGIAGPSICIRLRRFREACNAFGCAPFVAIVVDGANIIRCFLLSLDQLEDIATGKTGSQRYWLMSESFFDARSIFKLL